MKKVIVVIATLMVLLTGCTVAERAQMASMSLSPTVTPSVSVYGEPSFRKASWGMTRDDVKRLEENKLVLEQDDNLVYESTLICGKKFNTVYSFDKNDKLEMGMYTLAETFVNENNYVELGKSVFLEMYEKYGKPKSYEAKWLNDRYKNSPDKLGMAVITGEYRIDVFWELPNEIVAFQLYGENYKANVVITYAISDIKDKESNVGL